MNEQEYSEQLVRLVRRGVGESLGEFASVLPSAMTAYALCTDDCLSTLFCAALDTRTLEESGSRELILVPADWPAELERSLRPASDLLRRHYETCAGRQDAFVQHVESSFAAIVTGLGKCRLEGIIEGHVLLMACSTDPSPGMENRERAALPHLNPPHVLQKHGLTFST